MEEIMKNPAGKRVAPLTIVLGFVFVFFCLVLVYVYAETKRINPVMLDEHGNPIGQSAQHLAQQPVSGRKH